MRWVLTRADLVIANSAYTLGLVTRAAPRARVVAIPLGVDAHRFSPGTGDRAREQFGVDRDKRVVLSVARINRYKGFDVVFRALAALPETVRRGFRYLIAGRGADLEPLQREVEQLGLTGIVRWLGYVAEADLPDVYRAADLFALCTREAPESAEVDGFGLVFLEAQACGIPVVGTRSGGIPDAVREGDGGWLIAEDDRDALTRIVGRLWENPAEFREMGRRARSRVEAECTWNHYIEKVLSTLRQSGIYGC